MYYTSRLASNHNKRCIGVATSPAPETAFTPSGTEPIACPPGDGTAIDPNGWLDTSDNGKPYLLYRLRDPHDRIMLQQLYSDGLSKDSSPPIELIHVDPSDGKSRPPPTPLPPL